MMGEIVFQLSGPPTDWLVVQIAGTCSWYMYHVHVHVDGTCTCRWYMDQPSRWLVHVPASWYMYMYQLAHPLSL